MVVDYFPSDKTEEVIMPSRRCPHCKAVGSYAPAEHRPFKRSGEMIRFEICSNADCGGAVATVYRDSNFADQIDTYPKLEEEPDELLPDGVKIAFRQALQSLNERIWDGCVLMCRRALEEAMSDLSATGQYLYNKIESLASQHRITPEMGEWAHEGRLAGKLGAHGLEEQNKQWNKSIDAEEIVEFCKWFFRYVYVLPKQLERRRERIAAEAAATQPAESSSGPE